MLKAVIFDMDGVLVDSEPVHFAANYKMLKESFGIQIEYEDYRQFIGSTIEKIWKFYREKYRLYDYEWNELMQMAEDILAKEIEQNGYPVIEGAAQLVRELKKDNYLLAVASSSPMSKIDKNLRQLDLYDIFDKKVSGMELKNPKPSPDIFLEAARLLCVEPSECIVVEDSKNGVLAAKAAGMACIGFINKNSGNQDLSKADYLFESFLNIDEPFVRMVHNHCFGEPWCVLKTKRLKIREMCADDVDELIRLYSDDEITKYMEGLFERESELEYIREYISNVYKFYGYGMWIIEKNDGTIIGRAGIEYYESDAKGENLLTGIYRTDNSKTEGCHLMGYVIGTQYRHNGYAFEACRAIIDYAVDTLGIKEIRVNVHKDNEKSIELAKKLGFVFAGGNHGAE